jgi:hypothetical protein
MEPGLAGHSQIKLLNGEEIYIEVKPMRRIYARKAWLLTLIGLPILLISAFLIFFWLQLPRSSQVAEIARFTLLVCSVPFLLFGLFLTAGHYLLFSIEAPSVSYVVTSRRVIIRRGFIIHKEFEIFVDSIAGLEVIRHEGPENPGTIRFIASGSVPGAPFYMKRFPTEKFRGDVHYAIEAVPDVDSVRFFIEKAIDQRKQADAFSY